MLNSNKKKEVLGGCKIIPDILEYIIDITIELRRLQAAVNGEATKNK